MGAQARVERAERAQPAPHRLIGGDVVDAHYAEHDIGVLCRQAREVRQRIVFADSVAAGRLARETAPDSAAAQEITALVDELLRWPS